MPVRGHPLIGPGLLAVFLSGAMPSLTLADTSHATPAAERSWSVEPYEFPEGVPESAVPSHAGAMFAYVQRQADQRALIVYRVEDGSTTSIANAGEISDLSWSYDDRALAYGSDNGIWVVRIDGSAASRRITHQEQRAMSPTWCPDGRRIAYLVRQLERQDLWSIDLRDGMCTQLTDHPGFLWKPRWSPTGDHVAFYTTWNGEMTDIYQIDVNTRELIRVTHTPGEDFHPSWSADGSTIYFVSRRDTSENAIWAYDIVGKTEHRLTVGHDLIPMNVTSSGPFLVRRYDDARHVLRVTRNGDELVQVTSGPATFHSPCASPTDDVVAAITTGVGPEDVLVTMNGRGETLREFGDGRVLHRNPRFSPSGDWIAYQASTGGWRDTNDIWLTRADGSGNRQLTDRGYMVNAIWCGEDDSLVLSGRADDGFGPIELWRGRPDRATVEPLLKSDADLVACDCAPDGRLVYVEYTPDGPVTNMLDLNSGAVVTPDHAPEHAEGLRYAPDGVSFAYLLDIDGRTNVYVFDGPTGEHTRLTDSPFRKSWPSWDHSGEWIWFGEERVSSQVMRLTP